MKIEIAEYDPRWPAWFATEGAKIGSALGDAALRVEHVGSTAVPGLAAKPVVDIALEVANPADELAYFPQLESAGYAFRFREPGWHEHRFFQRSDPAVNLHVFPAGCSETARMIAFRDRLRMDSGDRRLYEAAKRELARREWNEVQEYAEAKASMVQGIMTRCPGPPGFK